MNYPLISEYLEAIKHSEDNFNELTNLRPVYDEAGEIVMSSGNFAVVFKMKDESSGKLYAVKCFLREQEGRDIAYQQITDELEYVSSNYLCSISTTKKNCLLILQFLPFVNFLYYSWTGQKELRLISMFINTYPTNMPCSLSHISFVKWQPG